MNEILTRALGLLGLGFVWLMYLPSLIATIIREVLRDRLVH